MLKSPTVVSSVAKASLAVLILCTCFAAALPGFALDRQDRAGVSASRQGNGGSSSVSVRKPESREARPNTRLALSEPLPVVPIARPSAVSRHLEETDDTKEPSSEQREAAARESDRYINQQAESINKLPGARVRTEDLSEEKTEKKGFKLSWLNPISWFLSPITKLQKQTVRLEQQIVKLIGPISALQPAMQGLEKKMDETSYALGKVRDDMGEIHHEIKSMRGSVDGVTQEIAHVRHELRAVSGQMGGIGKDLGPMRGGLAEVAKVIAPMSNDLRSVSSEMLSVSKQMSSMRSSLIDVSSQMNQIHQDLVTTETRVARLESPIRDLKDPVVSLNQPIKNLQAPISSVGGRMQTLESELNDLKVLMSLVLTSIFVCALLVAIGTPLAAILVWRNRHKLLPKPSPAEAREEAQIGEVADHAGKMEDAKNEADKKLDS